MTITINPAMQSLLVQKSHRFATCWKIQRMDGTILRLTDHDTDLPIFEVSSSPIYSPIGGLSATARRRLNNLQEQNYSVVAALSANAITWHDLIAGFYREARIDEQLVDWKYPWAGYFKKTTYWIVQTEFDGEVCTAEISGLGYWLRAKVGGTHGRTCRYTLGEGRCNNNGEGVVLGSLSDIGTAGYNGGSILIPRLSFTTGDLFPSTTGYWDLGKLVWLSGANSGVISEVRNNVSSGPARLTLQLPTPFDIAVGDFYLVYPGCDKLKLTCQTKFANYRNNGAYYAMPGTDKLIRSATLTG